MATKSEMNKPFKVLATNLPEPDVKGAYLNWAALCNDSYVTVPEAKDCQNLLSSFETRKSVNFGFGLFKFLTASWKKNPDHTFTVKFKDIKKEEDRKLQEKLAKRGLHLPA